MVRLFFSTDPEAFTLAELEMVARVYLSASRHAPTPEERWRQRENARKILDAIEEHWRRYGFNNICEEQLIAAGMTCR